MRITLVLGVAAVLAGCNSVTSSTPLFSQADTVGQGQIRPGVWVTVDPDCAVDVAKPTAQWPSCANAWVVRPGEIVQTDASAKPPKQTHYKIVLARGDPAVLQIATGDAGQSAYAYAGLRALKTDAQGRIVEYNMWMAMCGPPSPSNPSSDKPTPATRDPLPGLVMDKDQQDCVAIAANPVRDSVAKSEAWSASDKDLNHARWVRDGET